MVLAAESVVVAWTAAAPAAELAPAAWMAASAAEGMMQAPAAALPGSPHAAAQLGTHPPALHSAWLACPLLLMPGSMAAPPPMSAAVQSRCAQLQAGTRLLLEALCPVLTMQSLRHCQLRDGGRLSV